MKSRLIPSLSIALVAGLALNFSFTGVHAQEDPAAASASGSSASTLDHLKLANAALSSGRYHDALDSFDAAIAADPKAYLTYYRRATASLSLGRTSAALQDLDTLLSLHPNFPKAHIQKAKIHIKEGDLAKAHEAIKSYRAQKKEDEEGMTLESQIEVAQKHLKDLDAAVAKLQKELDKGKSPENDSSLAEAAQKCINHASGALEVAPGHLEARRQRADCQVAMGEYGDALADWTRIVTAAPSIPLLLRLSSLSYFVIGEEGSRDREAGIAHLKSCLTSDPDNKVCARAHRRARNIDKALKKAHNFVEGNQFRSVLTALKGAKIGGPTIMEDVEAAIKADMEVPEGGGEPVLPRALKDAVERSALLHELRALHCRAHFELTAISKAMPYCNAVLARDPDDVWATAARGDEHLKHDRLEEAIRDLSSAFEKTGQQNSSLRAKLQKAQARLKQSKTKDYYKVLGVSRDADPKTIKKAYRKLAKLHHPDKGGDQAKMAQINEAFGVLGNEELKERFDRGDDPNDPSGGAQGGYAHPFQQGGHPFAQFFQQQGGGGAGQQFFRQQGGQQFSFKFG